MPDMLGKGTRSNRKQSDDKDENEYVVPKDDELTKSLLNLSRNRKPVKKIKKSTKTTTTPTSNSGQNSTINDDSSSSNNKQEKINKNVVNKSDGASKKIIAENVDQNRADKKRKSFHSKDNEQKNPVRSILLFSI
jgi:hypothetical protein